MLRQHLAPHTCAQGHISSCWTETLVSLQWSHWNYTELFPGRLADHHSSPASAMLDYSVCHFFWRQSTMWCMKTGATCELCLSRECVHKRRHYFKQTTSAWALLIIKWSSRATSLMVAYSNGCMGFTAARSVHPSIVQSLTFRYLFLSTWHTKLVLPPNQNLFCTSRESKCSFVKQSPIWKHLSPSMNSFVCNDEWCYGSRSFSSLLSLRPGTSHFNKSKKITWALGHILTNYCMMIWKTFKKMTGQNHSCVTTQDKDQCQK